MSLSDALASSRTEETRKAARALLRRPLLRARGADADAYVLARRHATELREWFHRNAGWRLVVDSEVARLVKTVADTSDPTHPARDARSGTRFTRRRYVLACLALAVLDRADAQITLGRLAEQVVLAAADPELTGAGVTFTLEGREERADLVSVVRLLLDLGALTRVAGDEDAFVADTGDALYDVERRVLVTLLAGRRGPSTISAIGESERLAALTAEITPDTDELRNQAIRHELTRRLLDDPVLYLDELDEAQTAYLTGQRSALTRRITELTGLVAEVRAEGIAMVDPSDDLTDVRMPEVGTDGHVTLLLAEYLATAGTAPLAQLHAQVRRFGTQHRAYWRRAAAEPGAEVGLTAQALDRLEALRLIRREPDVVRALTALSRYALAEPTVREPVARNGIHR